MRCGELLLHYYDVRSTDDRPTYCHGPAGFVAREMGCTTNTTTYNLYSTATTSALPMRRPTGFHNPRHGPGRVQLVPKRAEDRFPFVMIYFAERKLLVYTREVRTTMWYYGSIVFWMVEMPRRAPLLADSSPLLICCWRRDSVSTPLRRSCVNV